MKTLTTLLIGLTALFFVACSTQAAEGIQRLSATEFQQKIESTDVQLIDVRTEAEVAEGYIDGAQNMDVNQADFEQKVADLDKSKPVCVYCRAGSRSLKAANKLAEMGFTEIYDLKPGITGWQDEGLPVTK